MSRLTEQQQDTVTAQVNANIEGRPTRTDPQTWYVIRQGLTSDDGNERQRWSSKSLVQFVGQLSAEDLAALEKLREAVRTNDGGAEQTRRQNITRMANNALRAQGIDPTPRPDSSPDSDAVQAATFHRVLQNELSAFESRGRQPTVSEAYGMVEGLMATAIKSGWIAPRHRQASVSLGSGRQSTDDSDKRNEVLAQAARQDASPRANREPVDIQQASLADGPSETQDDRETRIFGAPIRRGVPPSPKEVPRWRWDFIIPEYPPKPPELPVPKPHEAPAPAPGNRIALPRNDSRNPSK